MARQYDVIVFGATGYTGKLTAQYISSHMPTDIKWAIAGRSETKLEAVAKVCKALNPDRIQPGKFVVSFRAIWQIQSFEETVLVATWLNTRKSTQPPSQSLRVL
jgi:hypothetical protein